MRLGYNDWDLLPALAFRRVCGRLATLEGGKPSAPDYTPLANASAESAKIMSDLGQQQLDFAKQQYDDSLPMYKDLVAQQLQIGDQSKAQADDYYNYMVQNQRPVEAALNADAMQAGSESAQQAAAGKAMADARVGSSSALGTAMREGARLGFSPEKMATASGNNALGYASLEAASANDAAAKEKALGYAKKLDVAGLYRGLPGASSGAYNVALNAGNSASNNEAAPGAQYQAGVAGGVNTIASGRNMYQGGLQGVLNAQTSIYNNGQNNGIDVGGLLSGGAALAKAGVFSGAAFSDRRLKENISPAGEGPYGLTLYEFNYIGDERTWLGVMADEVEQVMPDAVIEDESGYKRVDYAMLGIDMVEVV